MADTPGLLLLALPRGGVPVAAEVARALRLPLDVYLVRKLGVPRHEELAMGAIASGGVRVLNQGVVDTLRVPPEWIERVAREEQAELERRERLYRGDRPPPDLRRRPIVLIDDGLATGSTMRAACHAARQSGAGRIVVAVPVAAAETVAELRIEVDEVICPFTPDPFVAVGLWYADFGLTSDGEVKELLAATAAPRPGPGSRGEQGGGTDSAFVREER
jgi:putative phosphoribosyl transferase